MVLPANCSPRPSRSSSGPDAPCWPACCPSSPGPRSRRAAHRPSRPRHKRRCSRRSWPLLERLADRSRTALVVEDLHWADHSTLDLARLPRPQRARGTGRRPDLPDGRAAPGASPAAVPGRSGPQRPGGASGAEPLRPGRDRPPARGHPRQQAGRRARRGHLPAVGGQRVLRGGVARRRPGGSRAEPAPQSGERPAEPGPGSLRGRAGDTAIGGRRRWADRGGPVVRGERPAGRGPARSLAGRGRPPGAGSGSGRRDATASATR